ncbi:hypothetical protein Y1Q_0009817 [Alligator mississippiensis]|uniref:Uncharacterized protein n=1 Tax=Alligator mississippiensis TaxID=8496 RepID=A0A151MWW7_ALLMI|nr:hypothetical protein Y1Q_0009817 [Alligator mississippiensis]
MDKVWKDSEYPWSKKQNGNARDRVYMKHWNKIEKSGSCGRCRELLRQFHSRPGGRDDLNEILTELKSISKLILTAVGPGFHSGYMQSPEWTVYRKQSLITSLKKRMKKGSG